MRETSWATLARQIFSSRQLYEQVVDLFANHLHVAIPSDDWDTTPSYVTDVLREHAFGTYRDMLRAAMRHPAMLRYLNNDVSTKTHVNENLGRELLELHTVGLAGGYTEDDVVASARVLTGRSVQDGTFLYRAERHHTGPLTVLDWSDPNATAEGGLAVGDSYLDHLARHPATARTLATKIAVRFVSDAPPASLVDRLAATYLEHDTDIRAVLAVLFRSSEFWASVGLKARRPLDDAVGLARVLDIGQGADLPAAVTSLYWELSSAGHTPFGWDPPNGFPDVAPAWINAGGMVNRWSLHRSLVNNWGGRWVVPAATDEVPAEAGSTTGAWIDALAERYLGQPMSAAHRSAVLAAAEALGSDPLTEPERLARVVLPLLVDSPYFQLR